MSRRTGMLHRKWFLNTMIGRFLRVEVGTAGGTMCAKAQN